jgi:hypothetical protein
MTHRGKQGMKQIYAEVEKTVHVVFAYLSRSLLLKMGLGRPL